jgi:FkbM family methyltransferase
MGIKLILGKLMDRGLDKLIRMNYRWAAFMPTGRVLALDLKRWHLQPSVIIDVGANEGQTARYFKRHFKQSKIYCFEPVRAVYELLAANCHHPDMQCFQQALGDEQAVKKIYSSPFYSGTASILGARQDNLYLEEEVQVTTGMTVHQALGLAGVDFLKIDTEGYELNVLKGFGSLLTTQVKMVLAETGFVRNNPCQTHVSELINFMSANGFMVSGVYHQFRFPNNKKELHHCDMLFINTRLVHV